jgi:hypothetical protein
MARRFFYISLGILCLVAAYQLGAERARADWDQESPGVIWGQSGRWFVTASGEAWEGSYVHEWQRHPEFDLPIPATEVKFYAGRSILLTKDEVLWEQDPGGQWVEVGPFPGGPVTSPSGSWGKVKESYR